MSVVRLACLVFPTTYIIDLIYASVRTSASASCCLSACATASAGRTRSRSPPHANTYHQQSIHDYTAPVIAKACCSDKVEALSYLMNTDSCRPVQLVKRSARASIHTRSKPKASTTIVHGCSPVPADCISSADEARRGRRGDQRAQQSSVSRSAAAAQSLTQARMLPHVRLKPLDSAGPTVTGLRRRTIECSYCRARVGQKVALGPLSDPGLVTRCDVRGDLRVASKRISNTKHPISFYRKEWRQSP